MTRYAPSSRPAFSLVELLLAIGILAIGLISIAALFPAGIVQQRRSIDDVMGPIVADNAIATIRHHVSADDFGTFEEYGVSFLRPTVEGDWGWMRPGVLFGDEAMHDFPDGAPLDETGSLDIFGHFHAVGTSVSYAAEFPSGYPGGPQELSGVPWNTLDHGAEPPLVLISQRERYYPQASDIPGAGVGNRKPEFVWDCMFRRYQGRIQVAIFVMRVSAAGGGRVEYLVAPNPNDGTPPIPTARDFSGAGTPFVSGQAVLDWTDGVAFDPGALGWAEHWQVPRQWLLDQNGIVHQVLNGRRSTADGPVEFVEGPGGRLGRGYTDFDVTPGLLFNMDGVNDGLWADWIDPSNGGPVTNLWYVPAVDVNGLMLTPVFVTVREL